MDSESRKLGIELLRMRGGPAFAGHIIGEIPGVDEKTRTHLQEALRTPDVFENDALRELYLGTIVKSPTFHEARRFFSPELYVQAKAVSIGILTFERPPVDFPAVEHLPDGRVRFDTRDWAFVDNLHKHLEGALADQEVGSFMAYLDMDEERLTVGPLRRKGEVGAPVLSDEELRGNTSAYLPVSINLFTAGETIALFPSREDDAGIRLTPRQYREGVALLRDLVRPYLHESIEDLWNHNNPTLNPFDHPYGYELLILIREEAVADEDEPPAGGGELAKGSPRFTGVVDALPGDAGEGTVAAASDVAGGAEEGALISAETYVAPAASDAPAVVVPQTTIIK